MTEEVFWEQFRTAVKATGLSLRRLSALLDASPTSMSRWYNGQNAPPRPFRRLLVRAVSELPQRKKPEQLELSDADGRHTQKA